MRSWKSWRQHYQSARTSMFRLALVNEWTLPRSNSILIYNDRDYFPWTIAYEAFTEKVDEWSTTLEMEKARVQWTDPLPNEIQEILDEIESKMRK